MLIQYFQVYQINIQNTIQFDSSWVHLRKSNTEPIIRIFTESKSKEEADELANQFYDLVKTFN